VSGSTSSQPTDSGAQRVTLAVLATKLDYLIEKVSGMCQRFDSHETRIDKLEKSSIALGGRMDQIGRGLAWVGGILAAVIAGVIIAAVVYWAGWR